jgi:hypothetical protein
MNEYFTFLDVLRDSGATNMFGAAPYLVEVYGMDKRKARDILLAWMQSKQEKADA